MRAVPAHIGNSMTTGGVELTSYDDNIAAALTAFSKLVRQAGEASFQGFLSRQEAQVRRGHLLQIANDVEALAKHPRTATYQAFERLLNKAQELGANIPRETIITVGSAFIHRPYVRPKLPASSSGTN
jgi:hypothetical protein